MTIEDALQVLKEAFPGKTPLVVFRDGLWRTRIQDGDTFEGSANVSTERHESLPTAVGRVIRTFTEPDEAM